MTTVALSYVVDIGSVVCVGGTRRASALVCQLGIPYSLSEHGRNTTPSLPPGLGYFSGEACPFYAAAMPQPQNSFLSKTQQRAFRK